MNFRSKQSLVGNTKREAVEAICVGVLEFNV